MQDIVAKLREEARTYYGMSLDGEPCDSEMVILSRDLRWQAADAIDALVSALAGISLQAKSMADAYSPKSEG